jgi:hypothetical protein
LQPNRLRRNPRVDDLDVEFPDVCCEVAAVLKLRSYSHRQRFGIVVTSRSGHTALAISASSAASIDSVLKITKLATTIVKIVRRLSSDLCGAGLPANIEKRQNDENFAKD